MSSRARLLRYVSMGRSSARSEIPTRRLPSPMRCAARIWFTPTHHRFPGPTSSARSRWRRSTSLMFSSTRVATQDSWTPVSSDRATERAPSAPMRMSQPVRWPPWNVSSQPPSGRGVAATSRCRQTIVSPGSESSRRSRSALRSISGRPENEPGCGSWCTRVRPVGSTMRCSSLSGRASDRNRPARPASARACCPDSGCRSRLPPCGRADWLASRSYTTASMPRRCRIRASVSPPRPPPAIAIRILTPLPYAVFRGYIVR
jgi:hypothetical protein